jgi:hypothetical protein
VENLKYLPLSMGYERKFTLSLISNLTNNPRNQHERQKYFLKLQYRFFCTGTLVGLCS